MAVTFEVTVDTRWGDTVVLVGSTTQFGNWDPTAGMRLTTNEHSYPVWRSPPNCEIRFTDNADPRKASPCPALEWKVVILRGSGEPDWEPLVANRKLDLIDGSRIVIGAKWSLEVRHLRRIVCNDVPHVMRAPCTAHTSYAVLYHTPSAL